jgi:putative restriction endonuclease
MIDSAIQPYINIDKIQLEKQLLEMLNRQIPQPGSRQVKFNSIEVLLCYGLFRVVNPHRYGGWNKDRLPASVTKLAIFFRRPPNSITTKMLNLDGSLPHSARSEVALFAYLSSKPESYYLDLYTEIIRTARNLSIGEDVLPDFLGIEIGDNLQDILLGQEELPLSSTSLLVGQESELEQLNQEYHLGEQLTEKLAERKVRLSQHLFTLEVLENCNYQCVFCGFQPISLPTPASLLRASHIKPWAVSNNTERLDVRNGLAACPTHDVAFDRGYLTVNGGYRIHIARLLEQSLLHDPGVVLYFQTALSQVLILPTTAKKPGKDYLIYHQANIFKAKI